MKYFSLLTYLIKNKACGLNKYGLNCSQTCACPNARTCDNKIGCICNKGYTGSDCNTIIDPCLSKRV